MSNGNCLFGSASFSLVEDTSQVHEPKVMADVIIIIIIIIINTLFEIEKKKEKSQLESVMCGKLFYFLGPKVV